MADRDLQIRGGGGGLKKMFNGPLGPSLVKNNGGASLPARGPSPGSASDITPINTNTCIAKPRELGGGPEGEGGRERN